jgi:Mg-chelatase subunit ChlD
MSDIPWAYATATAPVNPDYTVPVEAPLIPQRQLVPGRSSRVILPTGDQSSAKQLTESDLRTLREQGFTTGLCQSLVRNSAVHVLRIWVVDNSGSMSTNDGHRIIETKKKDDVKVVNCTRWTELQECVEYHIQMAALLEAPTVFRLLNDPGRIIGPQQFSIAERRGQYLDEDLAVALQTMRSTNPSGVTPLSQHLMEIRNNLRQMEGDLRRDGTKVVIVLATDGLPTDERGYGGSAAQNEFVHALRAFEGLPVWIVVRLCTDEEHVVEFYNDLDAQLELSLEVLDDFLGEAQEVHRVNGWLNYALPIHRMREMGFYSRLFDLLDERTFTKDELRDFLYMLFGSDKMDGAPDPDVDWKGFVEKIDRIQKAEKKQWNPVTKKIAPWVDLRRLNKDFNKGNCSIM